MFDRLKRREFITLIGGAAAWPLTARAQQPERMRRIGIVMPFAKGDSVGEARIRAFKQELAKLGWTDGGNIQFDERWPADNMDLVRSQAASLVASNPDIIIVLGGRIVPILMRLTRSIPVVLPGQSDPVGVGWAQSLARPGGNVTGFTGFELSMLGKSLETLKQIAPATVRVALIYNPDNPNSVHYRRISEGASARLAIEMVDYPSMALPTSIVPLRASPIVATAAFSSCPTLRPTRCATTSLAWSRGAACQRSIRSRSS